MSESWAISMSAPETVDDGIAPLATDQARGDLHPGRRLATLVLRRLEQAPDALDGRGVVAFAGELLRRHVALDQALQDRVEHRIGRQRILVLLVGLELGRRRLGDD